MKYLLIFLLLTGCSYITIEDGSFRATRFAFGVDVNTNKLIASGNGKSIELNGLDDKSTQSFEAIAKGIAAGLK